MSSYLSNLLTHTTSRYNSLRRTLLSSEDDGDTEDDSHVCRVLRAYYTEKGRPYPNWLPPDPNDRKAVTPQPTQRPGYFTNPSARNAYGTVQQPPPGGQRGSLSDLWDPPAASAPPAAAQPTSLRNARRPLNPPQPSAASLAPPQARPLPSQRAGSHQALAAQQQRPVAQPSPPSSSSGTAQDRLKARLWGGRPSSASSAAGSATPSPPASSVGAPNPYNQPAMSANAPWSSGNPYDGDSGGRNQRYGR